MYEFVLDKNYDNFYDYSIFYNSDKIGILLISKNETNYFIRQIRIYNNYQGIGHATKIINKFIEKTDKPIRYCISTHSSSAIHFWKKMKDKYGEKIKKIKGELYEIN